MVGGLFIIMRLHEDGGIELTGWGTVVMISLAAWVGLFTSSYRGDKR